MIIIDNLEDNFRLQPDNGIPIKTWNEDMNDNELYYLYKFLKQLHSFQIRDIRHLIKNVRKEINSKIKKGVTYPFSHINFNKFFK